MGIFNYFTKMIQANVKKTMDELEQLIRKDSSEIEKYISDAESNIALLQKRSLFSLFLSLILLLGIISVMLLKILVALLPVTSLAIAFCLGILFHTNRLISARVALQTDLKRLKVVLDLKKAIEKTVSSFKFPWE